jgi:hypothetical protein
LGSNRFRFASGFLPFSCGAGHAVLTPCAGCVSKAAMLSYGVVPRALCITELLRSKEESIRSHALLASILPSERYSETSQCQACALSIEIFASRHILRYVRTGDRLCSEGMVIEKRLQSGFDDGEIYSLRMRSSGRATLP